MWLIASSVRQAIESGTPPTATEQAVYEARFHDSDVIPGGRILAIAGDTAEIAIKGVLTSSPNFMAFLLGGGNTLYSEINAAIQTAETDDAVNKIILKVESPGGTISGLFDTLAALQAAKKPIDAVVVNMAASAAYAIVSQAGRIEASNVAVMLGSIGILSRRSVSSDEISITSTEAPKKAPDVSTAEGVAAVKEELDAIHEIFVEAIASGRDTTVEKVNANFGQGATLLAREALKRGMIDAITGEEATETTAIRGNNQEASNMDLKQLQAEHPETYVAAVQLGTTNERDRVTAHLTMGDASGDMKTACTAITEGSVMTATLQATYMTAGMNRKDTANRIEDDAQANAGDNASSADDADAGDAVAALVESKLGLGDE